jgi:hypothetical protein
MQAPTATELLNHPTVQRAIEEAWADSMPDDPDRRHEEGGWIYLQTTTGEIVARRAPGGSTTAINLCGPDVVADHVLVGKFHTHPNPTDEGWESGPSADDILVDALHGVPDLIRADDGLHLSGPAQRRGGLLGEPGYPA